jgi:mRNA-degrading endonuclease RelE of RelBE toxin-antitoxin system
VKIRLTAAAGLGKRFLSEVESGRQRIEELPNAWHPLGRGARQYRLRTFPYGVVYMIEPDEEAIVIVSVVHLRCRATHWRARLAAYKRDKQ